MRTAGGNRARRRTMVSAASLALVLSAGILLPISPGDAAVAAHYAEYPTWDEVQAARGSEAATTAAIATIDQLLSELQADAARLGDAAVARTADAASAEALLDRATAAVSSLTARASEASQRTRLSAAHAGQVAAAIYRAGGTDLSASLLLTDDDDSSLLYRLGALGKLSERLEDATRQATTDRNLAESLRAQAAVARADLDAASIAAEVALASARSAQDAANSTLAAQQADQNLLFDQLASLKNTTAQIEQRYRVGQQSAAAPVRVSGDATTPAAEDTRGDNEAIEVPNGEINDVAAARSYAFGQLVEVGMGADQNNCLLSLWNRESGWRTNAYNASSGAYGIPQSLPGSKMSVMGADWRTSYVTQVNWGLAYISARYSSPCGAWAHSQSVGWY